MPAGDNIKKGQRGGGRQLGTPNRRTTERLEAERIARQAQDEVNRAYHAKVKLGKDVLEEYMVLFGGLAMAHRPRLRGETLEKGHKVDEAKFLTYAKLTVETARDLAAFQSPKFKAIAVMAPPPNPLQAAQPASPIGTVKSENVIRLDDPVAMARFYQSMIKQVK